MRSFLTAFLLFVLVTLGLYLSKQGHLPTQLAQPSSNIEQDIRQPLDNKLVNSASAKNQQVTFSAATVEKSYQLATQIRRCRNVPKSAEQLSSWLDQAQAAQEPQAYIDDVLSLFDQCSNLHVPNNNYINLLLSAANQGHDKAISALWSIGDNELSEVMELEDLPRAQFITKRTEFIEKKYSFTKTSALQGQEFAIERLVKAYQHYDPETGKPNLIKALAYAYFAVKHTNNNDFYRKLDWQKQTLEKKLNYQQLEQAQEYAAQLSNSQSSQSPHN